MGLIVNIQFNKLFNRALTNSSDRLVELWNRKVDAAVCMDSICYGSPTPQLQSFYVVIFDKYLDELTYTLRAYSCIEVSSIRVSYCN